MELRGKQVSRYMEAGGGTQFIKCRNGIDAALSSAPECCGKQPLSHIPTVLIEKRKSDLEIPVCFKKVLFLLDSAPY